jgi:hypothetical protein
MIRPPFFFPMPFMCSLYLVLQFVQFDPHISYARKSVSNEFILVKTISTHPNAYMNNNSTSAFILYNGLMIADPECVETCNEFYEIKVVID